LIYKKGEKMELLEITLEAIKGEIEENKNNAKFSDLYIKLLNELLEEKKRSIDNLKLIKDKYKKFLLDYQNENLENFKKYIK
jgi:hypothetical protein